MLDSDGWLGLDLAWPGLGLARNEEYSRISPPARLPLLTQGGRHHWFHGHPMLRSGAARNEEPMNHFPHWDMRHRCDLAPEKWLRADR